MYMTAKLKAFASKKNEDVEISWLTTHRNVYKSSSYQYSQQQQQQHLHNQHRTINNNE